MKIRISERAAPVAAALGALATLACCLPLGIAGAAGALGLSVVLTPLRPCLIGLSLALLAIGSWQILRRQTCRRRSPVSLIVLALSAVLVLGVVLFPQSIASLMAELPW